MTEVKKKRFNLRIFARAVAFWLVTILVLSRVQGIVTKKYYYPSFENVNPTINGIKALEKNQLDVLFLGTSHMEYALSPLTLYEEMGILSYNLSTAKQSVPNSYYLLKDVLHKQTPKVVFLDVSSMFLENKDNAAWRFLLDSMPFGMQKMEMALAYRNFKNSDGFYAGLFPIIKYHSRWEELRPADFARAPKGFYYSAGQYVRALTMPATITSDQMNEKADGVSEKKYRTKVYEENIEWLNRIDTLCKKHGVDLVLVKIPSVSDPHAYHSAWTKKRSQAMKEVAKQAEIPFIDLAYDTDLQIDYQLDTVDKGKHLNMFGAKKATAFFQTYLTEKYSFEEKKHAQYDASLSCFNKLMELGTLQNMTDREAYLSYLEENKQRYCFAAVGQKKTVKGLGQDVKNELAALGFHLLDSVDESMHYAALCVDGSASWETMSAKETLEYADREKQIGILAEPKDIFLSISQKELLVDGDALNLAVIDKETGVCVDIVSFDPNTNGKELLRDKDQADELFKQYESILTRK